MSAVGAMAKWNGFGLAWEWSLVLQHGRDLPLHPRLYDLLVEHGFVKVPDVRVSFFAGPVPESTGTYSNLFKVDRPTGDRSPMVCSRCGAVACKWLGTLSGPLCALCGL